MLSRCKNANHVLYGHYGALGVAVCARWHRYEDFLADMGRRPSDKHSLDRIDATGNYEPGNCRWATMTTQNNNKRRNLRVTIDAESLTLVEWAARTKLPYSILHHRLTRGITGRLLLAPARVYVRKQKPTAEANPPADPLDF